MSPRHKRSEFTPPVLEVIETTRTQFKTAGLARLTIVSYERDFRVFVAWCKAAGREALPASADTVETYVTDLIGRGRKITTMERHVIGIQHTHRQAGYASPCGAGLRELLSGARRTLHEVPAQKEAVRLEDLKRMVAATGSDTPMGARDCALLLFGFASALRRSNLARLHPEDLTFTAKGILVHIDHEKQDRNGKGRRQLAVPFGQNEATCPVRAIRRWLDMRGGGPGALFCQVFHGLPNGRPILGNRIGQIVQESAARIGLDRKKYGAHSLRAGMATEALERGVNEVAIAQQTGHKSLDTLRLYFRSRDLFRGHACANLGL
jgi:site-specific recombinase XerD